MEQMTTGTDTGLDRVERSLPIDASAEEVWELVCRPGWWINDGDVEPDLLPAATSGVQVVRHPQQGTFEVHTLRADPPRYLSYRWLNENATEGTTVEFFLEDRTGGGITLRVVESGFETLALAAPEREKLVAEHQEGWGIELLAARTFVAGA